jgi:hypothetical protein
MIPDTCFVEGPSCRANRGVLLLDYLVQHAAGSKVVLHLRERREDSLPNDGRVGQSYSLLMALRRTEMPARPFR